MSTSTRTSLALLALGLLPALSVGQAAQEPQVRTFSGPVTPVGIDAATGVVSLPPSSSALDAIVVDAFDNGSCSTFFWSAPAPGEAWMDFGVKATGYSGVVTGVTVDYVTTALSTGAGGPGARFGLELRPGATGFGDVGSPVASFSFTGLPASPDGLPTAYALQIDLSASVACIPDGPLGWVFLEEGDAQATGPRLTQVGGCPSGTIDGLDAYFGSVDSTSYVTTFTLGQADIASLALSLNEDDGATVASATPRNTTNPADFSVTTLPVLCSTVECDVVLDPLGLPVSIVVAGAPDFVGSPSFFGTGDLLISLIPGPVLDIAAGAHSLPVPPKVSYIGQTVTVQGFRFGAGGSIDALNAVDLLIGT